MTTVLVAGATGLTGRAIVEVLRRTPGISAVRAVVRQRGALHGVEEVELPAGGFTALEASDAPLLAADVYVCALGTTRKKAGSREAFRAVDEVAILAFARLCAARGGRAFGLVSSSGANPRSPILYSRVKGEVDAAVQALAIPRVVIARPSLLIGDRAESRPSEAAAVAAWRALSPWMPRVIARQLGTPVQALAEHLVAELMVTAPGRRVIEAGQIGG
jgi:uncharacterized protein YbjT (DUF2867 family)